MTDMTEWKITQDTLENQLRLLQHIISTFPNPVFYSDVHGKFLGCNAAFAEIIGKKCEDLTGKCIADNLNPALITFFCASDTELLNKPGVVTFSGIVTYADGSTHKISVQKSTFTHFDGTLAGVVTMILSDRRMQE
jgi:PAS domain S-box-containing protein